MTFKDREVDIPDMPLDPDDPFGHNPRAYPGGGALPASTGVDDPDALHHAQPDAESGPAERPPEAND
jgi:hypothetical protein